jgi:hypothetical protein
MNKKITGFAYELAVVSSEAILNSGKKINGINATTGMGNASDTHNKIINDARAITLLAAGDNANGLVTYNKAATIMLANIKM